MTEPSALLRMPPVPSVERKAILDVFVALLLVSKWCTKVIYHLMKVMKSFWEQLVKAAGKFLSIGTDIPYRHGSGNDCDARKHV